MNNSMKVIGVFAYQGMEALCIEGDSCLIAGSQEKMLEHMKSRGMENIYNIKKTRYGEIKKGIEMGASYSFDEEAYERFYPLGKDDGMELKEWDQFEAVEKGKRFMTLRII